MHLLYAGFNYINSTSFLSFLDDFTADRSFVWAWLSSHGQDVLAWLQQPHILAIRTAWWITFAVVLIALMCVGFNPVGIGAGTLAAAFQSWAYGGFTPAGGLFATLTSVGMLGLLLPLQTGVAAVVATAVAAVVWTRGGGRGG